MHVSIEIHQYHHTHTNIYENNECYTSAASLTYHSSGGRFIWLKFLVRSIFPWGVPGPPMGYTPNPPAPRKPPVAKLGVSLFRGATNKHQNIHLDIHIKNKHKSICVYIHKHRWKIIQISKISAENISVHIYW